MYKGDQIKEDEMGGACGTHGRDEKFIQNFGWKNLKGRDNLEGVGVEGRIIWDGLLGK
jgi:hypothetical protein